MLYYDIDDDNDDGRLHVASFLCNVGFLGQWRTAHCLAVVNNLQKQRLQTDFLESNWMNGNGTVTGFAVLWINYS